MKSIPRLALFVLFVFVIRGEAQTPPPPPPPPAPAEGIPASRVKEWREFKHEVGNLAALMPGEPVEMSQSLDTEIGKIPVKIFTAENGMAAYLTMFVEYPVIFDTPGAVKLALDNGRDRMIGGRGANLVSEKEIAYGKYTGREWKAVAPAVVIYSRAYIVNQRLYMLLVMMPEDEDKRLSEMKSNDVAKFLDSFKLLREPDPPPATAGSLAQLERSAEKIAPPEDFFNRPTAWREFSSKEYAFNIQFPSEPFQQAIPLVPNDRKLDIQLWMAKGDGIICQMIVQPLHAPPRDNQQKEILFKSLVAGIAEGGEMRLLSEEQISFRSHPGRAYKLQTAAGAAFGKTYIIGSRVYLMIVLIIGVAEGEKEMGRFFDSFTPLDVPDSTSEPSSPPPPPATKPLPPPPEGSINVSGGVLQASAIKKVEPEYPPIARAAKADGPVQIHITVSQEGKVIQAEVISGHPLLRDAALAAARQWEFKPTEIGGAPVKVIGVLTFNFTLK